MTQLSIHNKNRDPLIIVLINKFKSATNGRKPSTSSASTDYIRSGTTLRHTSDMDEWGSQWVKAMNEEWEIDEATSFRHTGAHYAIDDGIPERVVVVEVITACNYAAEWSESHSSVVACRCSAPRRVCVCAERSAVVLQNALLLGWLELLDEETWSDPGVSAHSSSSSSSKGCALRFDVN